MKPKELYRGIVLTSKQFQEAKWYDEDLTPPNPPHVDEYGRKTVADGNEYGVYMSDNFAVADQVYGTPHHGGKPIENSPNIIVGGRRTNVNIPNVGIVYTINTDGNDVREPFITPQLRGHYNNGYQGKEWIADIIPKDSYSVTHAHIGSDLLHSQQLVIGANAQEVYEKVIDELKQREPRLQELANELSQLPESKRLRLETADIKRYEQIFGEGGLRYIDLDKYQVYTAKDAITYMQAKLSQQQPVDRKGLGALDRAVKSIDMETDPMAVRKALEDRLDERCTRREELMQEGSRVGIFNETIEQLEKFIQMFDEEIAPRIQLPEIDIESIDNGFCAPEAEIDIGSIGCQTILELVNGPNIISTDDPSIISQISEDIGIDFDNR